MKLSSKYIEKLENQKYVIVLISLISFILIPVHITILPISSSLIVVANFTFVIVAGISICQTLKNNYFYYLAGIATLLTIWLEYSYPSIIQIKLIRLFSSLILFTFLSVILIQKLVSDKFFNIKSILGAISGYIFIGLIGGVIFETIHFLDPLSFTGIGLDSGYTYFSFISINTVGYGDITPASLKSQALTILMNMSGQFYLTVVVAVFVGKFLTTNSKTN